jgi:inner membrane protein YidH
MGHARTVGDSMAEAAKPLDAGTRLAIDRTRLAYERTMMAWVRTAASLISFGFTIYKFFQLELKGPRLEHPIIGPREFALILICTGIFSLALAGLQHHVSLRAMKEEYGAIPRSVAGPVAGLVGLLGVLALLGVIVRA